VIAPLRQTMMLLLTATASAFTPTVPSSFAPAGRAHLNARAAAPKLFDTGIVTHAVDAASTLLSAEIFGLDTNPYGGVSSFSQTETGSSGDLNLVLLVGVIFPTVLTAIVYRDNIAAVFEPPPEVEPPPGWKKVPSESRPGKFSYLNVKTKERYDRIPNSASKE